MESFLDLWKMVSATLHTEVGDTAYNVWLSKIEPVSMTDEEVVLIVPTDFFKNIISARYGQLIADTLFQLTGINLRVNIVTGDRKEEQPVAEQPPKPDNDEFTFDNFIVGASNRFASAAAQAVATSPGTAYNPLFIYSPSGMGKTHLLFAIQNYIERNSPGKTIVYVKGDQFTNELIEAIGKNSRMEFRSKYRYADVLLVDDIQFIGGKESTQEEFFHTFNTLFQEKKQIVLTSDRSPKDIHVLEDRLRSRFEQGLIADIQPPEFETRIAIIKRKAAQYNVAINDDIATFIASKLKTNIRQLEGVVQKIGAICMVEREKPSLQVAQRAIRDIQNDVMPIPMTIERIISEVARVYEVQPEDIHSKRRTANLSLARQVAMYCVREVTGMSYEAIGEEFSGRDHTTVIYAVQQVSKKMEKQSDFRSTIDDIIENIKGH